MNGWSFAHGDICPLRSGSSKTAEVAIIALGPKPVRKFGIIEGSVEPVMLLAHAGETPPARLYYRITGACGKDATSGVVQVAFNRASSFRKIPAGRELTLYRKMDSGDEHESYITLPAFPPATRRIIFLLPSQVATASWEESPVIKMLALENPEFAEKQFILVNFAKCVVQHAFEDRVEAVPPDRMIGYGRDDVGEIYRLAARYGRERKIIYNTAVRLCGEGHIQLFVLHHANPESNAGRDIGVVRMILPANSTGVGGEEMD